MHHTVIKTSVITETSDNLVHRYASTSKYVKVNAIMFTKRTDNTLQLTRVKCPMFARGIHIAFQHDVGRSTERDEKIHGRQRAYLCVGISSGRIVYWTDACYTPHTDGRGGRVSML